jgi:hypothetical protein
LCGDVLDEEEHHVMVNIVHFTAKQIDALPWFVGPSFGGGAL